MAAPDWWRHSYADDQLNGGRGVWQNNWYHKHVPEGYVWRPGTVCTMAGWVLPREDSHACP